MDYTLPLIALLAIVLFVLALRLIKSIIKAALTAILITIIIVGGTTFFLVRDTKIMADGLSSNSSIFLLSDNKELITGFSIERLNMTTAESFSNNELKQFSTYYEKSEYKKILGDSYMMFIINKSAFPKTDKFDPDKVIEYLEGDKKELTFLNDMQYSNMPDTEAAAFSILVVYSLRNDPLYILKEYRNKNIILYPEPLSFRILRFFFGGMKR